MEAIILPSPTLHEGMDSSHSSPRRVNGSGKPKNTTFSTIRDSSISWGRRHHHGSWLHALGCSSIMLCCPILVIFLWISIAGFSGSLSAAYETMVKTGPIRFFSTYAPRPNFNASLGYGAWILFQAALYQFLPSKLSVGQLTPAGNLLQYRTNGLLAWVLTHLVFGSAVCFGLINSAILATNWQGLLVAANVFGFLLSGVAYGKALLKPTHAGDRKFSGSIVYDFYMGVELNPRFGRYFDFKLWTNGRPGIIAWTLIDFSFIAYQYELHGYVTKSILLTTMLHTIYVVDFFINEDWYLRTIDICHDHYGFYLAWGSVVWLPGVYTLQTQYLAMNPVNLSNLQAVLLLCTGLGGYFLFRSVNHQKDLVRRTKGNCKIWGEAVEVVKVKYRTNDGFEHNSILLCSGWWGYARHVNYFGDLILSYSMCATCGFRNLLPWTYAIFMTILLIHRCWRDEERCSMKYGKGWEEYCKRVKWIILPGLY